MPKKIRIKVCGMRDPKNISLLSELEPDMIGYIFYRGSKRYVGEEPDPAIFRIPGSSISRVGVFVNEKADKVIHYCDTFNLDLVQLHGTESPEYCMRLSEKGIPLVKAYSPGYHSFPGTIGDYIEQVKYLLFDTPSETFGGSGKQFDWDLIRSYSIPFPFILSGGIGPNDADRIMSIDHDWFYAVDVNSRFETEPGLKNIGLLKGFIEKLRSMSR